MSADFITTKDHVQDVVRDVSRSHLNQSDEPTPPVGSSFRITEDGNYRITEDGNNRITEGA